MLKSSHHKQGICDLELESRQTPFGDIVTLVLDHTDLDLSSGSGSLLWRNLHSANNSLASILPWDRSDLVCGSADLAGSAQLGPDRFFYFAKMKCGDRSGRLIRYCSVFSSTP